MATKEKAPDATATTSPAPVAAPVHNLTGTLDYTPRGENALSEGSVDVSKLPTTSLLALLDKGFRVVMSNEVKSAVRTWAIKESAVPEGYTDAQAKAHTDAWQKANAAAWIRKRKELQAAAIAKLVDGTYGEGTGGGGASKYSPLESEMRKIAEAGIRSVLEKSGGKMPTGEKTIKLTDGEFTREQLIERRLANPKFADKIKSEAEAIIAIRNKAIDESDEL